MKRLWDKYRKAWLGALAAGATASIPAFFDAWPNGINADEWGGIIAAFVTGALVAGGVVAGVRNKGPEIDPATGSTYESGRSAGTDFSRGVAGTDRPGAGF